MSLTREVRGNNSVVRARTSRKGTEAREITPSNSGHCCWLCRDLDVYSDGTIRRGATGISEGLEGRVKVSGNDTMWALSAVHGVGCCLRDLEKYSEALEYFERALKEKSGIL